MNMLHHVLKSLPTFLAHLTSIKVLILPFWATGTKSGHVLEQEVKTRGRDLPDRLRHNWDF